MAALGVFWSLDSNVPEINHDGIQAVWALGRPRAPHNGVWQEDIGRVVPLGHLATFGERGSVNVPTAFRVASIARLMQRRTRRIQTPSYGAPNNGGKPMIAQRAYAMAAGLYGLSTRGIKGCMSADVPIERGGNGT